MRRRARAARRPSPRSRARHAPSRRYWAVVGNGPNRIAAAEVRIKLVRALLQVDLLRRHRGQEAHRPVGRAADPRVRGGAAGLQRRRRGQGDRDLPGPQGRADRDRHRGRGAASPPRSRPSRCPAVAPRRSASCSRPWPATSSATRPRSPSTPRPGRSARRAPRSRRRSCRGADVDGDDLLVAPRPRASSRPAAASSTACASASYDGHLEAGTAVRLASLLRYATGMLPLDVYQVEHGKVGTPSVVVEDLTAALTAGIEELTRPVDAIKHQAKTVTVGISRSDEELLQVAAGARGARGRRGRDALELPVAAHARRARPGRRAGHRLHPLPHRGRPRRRRRHHRTSSTGAASRSTCRRAPTTTRACVGTKHRVGDAARGHGGRGAAATAAPSCIVPEVKDNAAVGLTLLHARFAPTSRPTSPAACCRATRAATARCATRSPRPSPPSTTRGSATFDLVDLLTEPVVRPRRPLAVSAVDADRRAPRHPRARHRPGRDRAVPARAAAARVARRSGCSPTASRRYAYEHHDPVPSLAARFGAKEAVMKALGVGLGAFAFRDVEVRARRRQRRALARVARRGRRARRRARRTRVAGVAHAHRHDRDGGRARARLSDAMEPVLTPEADGRGRRAHDRRRHAGRGADGARRTRGGVDGAPGAGGHVRPTGRGGVRQGQQRRRRLVAAACSRGWGVRVDRVRARRAIDRGVPSARCVAPTSWSTRCTAPASAARSTATPRGSPSSCGRFAGEVVAVDIPSGVDGLTGATSGARRCGRRSTVTFAAPQARPRVRARASHAGERRRSPTSASHVDDRPGTRGRSGRAPTTCAAWLPPARPDAHKWQSGVLVVGGSGGMTGAPMLVSHAAMRAGAGIVWCALPGRRGAGAAAGEVITRACRPTPPASWPAVPPRRCSPTSAASPRSRSVPVSAGPHPDLQFACARSSPRPARRWCSTPTDSNALAGDFTSLRSRRTLGAPAVLTPHDGRVPAAHGPPVGDDRIAAARALAERVGRGRAAQGPGHGRRGPGRSRVALNPTGGAGLGHGRQRRRAHRHHRRVPRPRCRRRSAAAAAGAWVHGRAADRLVARRRSRPRRG